MRFPWFKKTEAEAPPTGGNPESSVIHVSVNEQAFLALAREEARSAATAVVREGAQQAMDQMVERAAGLTNNSLTVDAPQPTIPGPNTGQSPYPLYAFDNPIWYSTPVPPQRRPGSIVTVQTLRQLADNYDVLRSCIQHLKREVAAVPIQIVAKNEKDNGRKIKRAIADAEAFFGQDGGLGGVGKRRAHFEGEIIEDISVVGAMAVFYQNARGGQLLEAVAIDAATIRPCVDAFGWPGPGGAVYEQWIWGVLTARFTREQLAYDGIASRSYTPFFASPVEWLINAVNSALRADDWNRRWLTDGNTPSEKLALPEAWTPDMVMQFAAYWDAKLAGDNAERQKTKFVPGGTAKVGSDSRKDQDFQEFELWLLRRTCAMMGVQPASLGFAGEQYKVSQNDSMESTSQFGAGVLLEFRKATYDDMLRRMGYGAMLECQNVTAREEKALERADRNQKLIGAPQKTINEGRKEEGLDPIDGGDIVLVPNTLIPLSIALQAPVPAATPTDPNSDTSHSSDPNAPDDPADDTPDDSDTQRARLLQGILRTELAGCRSVSDVHAVMERVARPSVYLVRHAPTKLSAKAALGWLNEPLSGEGRKEAKKIGAFMASRCIERILTSDLKRTVQTSKQVARRTGAPILQRDMVWRAWNLGEFEGRDSEQFKAVETGLVQNLNDQPLPGGESFNSFVGRFLPALLEVLADAKAGNIGTTAICSHSPCLKLTMTWLAAGCPSFSDTDSVVNPFAGMDGGTFMAAEIPMGAVLWLSQTKDGWTGKMYDVDAEMKKLDGKEN